MLYLEGYFNTSKEVIGCFSCRCVQGFLDKFPKATRIFDVSDLFEFLFYIFFRIEIPNIYPQTVMFNTVYVPAIANWILVWWELWNFSVVQMKFNIFLHSNEPPKMIFWYLVRHFDRRLSKIGYLQFSISILEAKNQFNLPESYLLI